jgi:hypothetical protein
VRTRVGHLNRSRALSPRRWGRAGSGCGRRAERRRQHGHGLLLNAASSPFFTDGLREDARAFAGRHQRERLVSPGPKALAARPWYWPRPRAWLTSHCEIETNLYSLVGGSGLTGERGLRQGAVAPTSITSPGRLSALRRLTRESSHFCRIEQRKLKADGLNSPFKSLFREEAL